MTAANDATLVSINFQAWVSFVADYKKNKEFEDLVKASEKKLQDYMEQKSASAKSMMQKMMGGTDQGCIALHFTEWKKVYIEEKEDREHLESINGANMKFSDLSSRQKKAAKNIAARTNDFDEQNFLAQCWFGWATTARLNRVISHYHNKLSSKKHQLDSVQSMFKTFATQLEKGIENSPR